LDSVGAEEGDYHVASDPLLEVVGPAEDPGEAPGEARVGEVALERRLEPGVAVASHYGVEDAFEGGVGGSKGREFPEQSLENWSRRGKDLAEGRTGGSPC
jgi:hypothetical protein